MIEFNCTVKDIFRRPNMIDKAVRMMADNGYTEYAVTYARVRDNMFNALDYASANMKEHEYEVAVSYFESRMSEQEIAVTAHYTHRTIRRYVRKACELISEYFRDSLGIKLLPVDTRYLTGSIPAGTFWEKADSVMKYSIENTCVVILYCYENRSINYICSTYGMGSDKVKKIIKTFNDVVTVYGIPEEKRSAV